MLLLLCLVLFCCISSQIPTRAMLTIPPSVTVFFFFALRQMAENLMAVAYENGVNLFDTAEVYASGRCCLFLYVLLSYIRGSSG